MQSAKSVALRLVLTKKRTEKEVREALVKKGFPLQEAEEAASYYRENGYIDHADYARRFAHDCAYIKGFGPQRISRELALRGVEEEYIDTAIDAISFELESSMESRFGNGIRTEKERAKIYGYYLRKGFAPSAIFKAMDALYTYE